MSVAEAAATLAREEMLAVVNGRAQAVDALLTRGADPNAADSTGTTPLAAALAANRADLVAALRRAGAH